MEEFNEKRIQILPIILTERAYLPSKEVTNPKRLKSCSSVRVRAQNLYVFREWDDNLALKLSPISHFIALALDWKEGKEEE